MEGSITDSESTAMPATAEIAVTDSMPVVPSNGKSTVGTETPDRQRTEAGHDIEFLSDVQVVMTVELGRAAMPVREVLKLHRGSVVELEKLVGQPADLLVNNTPMAKGEVIVINERFGFRITKFIKPDEN